MRTNIGPFTLDTAFPSSRASLDLVYIVYQPFASGKQSTKRALVSVLNLNQF